MDLESKIVDLEIRLTHQEAAIDELTKTNYILEKQQLSMSTELQDLKAMLKALAPSQVVSQDQETPPPHY